jgi:hypothetical protein
VAIYLKDNSNKETTLMKLMELIGTLLDRLMNKREEQAVLQSLQYLHPTECPLGDKKDIEKETEELFFHHLSRDNGLICSKMNIPNKS